MPPDFLLNGDPDAEHALILAHGAGAAMDSAFMEAVAAGIAANGVRVVRFEFPYMRAARESGKRRAPDREAVLLDSWREAFAAVQAPHVAIGGKSMGGRMASMVADELGTHALVCLGYPFHAPGRPENRRIAHLAELRTAALIVQGTRDPFGPPEDVAGYRLSPALRIAWLEGCGHDLAPSRAAAAVAASWARVADLAAAFVLAPGAK